TFVANVITAFLVTLAGAVLLLVAAERFMVAGEWLPAGAKPTAWRALCALGLALFLGGWVWQIVGYYRLGLTVWRHRPRRRASLSPRCAAASPAGCARSDAARSTRARRADRRAIAGCSRWLTPRTAC